LSESLAVLEQQRSSILVQILELGDFRSGSITAINGRCGKPNCHCHQPNQSGHGPNFRLTRKVDGKTVSESFSSAAELRKAQREVETFHRFRQLSQELLEINETICRSRPVADTLSLQEKNGGSDPTRNRARSRPTAASHLPWPPPDGASRSGSHRNGCALCHAPRWGNRAERTIAVSDASCQSEGSPLSVWSPGFLPGVAL
jgi:hypothetical protein